MSIQPLPSIAPARSIYFAEVLMARASITPQDAGCQSYLIYKLEKLGFFCEKYTINGVSNLVARWGQGPNHFAFSGHTDVVPPGPLDRWKSPPFSPVISKNKLYGRGAADMKTGIAAMLAATERTIASLDKEKVSFWWLITSDEEGEAEWGSKWIAEYLASKNVQLDMCLVGEPSASASTGDTIKIGRRGSLSGTIHIAGKQGHVAYPKTAVNAIHKASNVINALTQYPFDKGSDDFPGTTLQITHMDTGSFTDNIVPSAVRIEFNVRYSWQFNQNSLAVLLRSIINSIDTEAEVSFSRPCEAYLSKPNSNAEHCLIACVEKAIKGATGRYPVISTSGGTSDGRFFASEHTQVVEVGVPNTTIHQINEHIHVSDLLTLEDIYTDILKYVGER
ncbi:succinyl-diaminopimelate desuccinylase [Alteromonas macleodii]|jgi:succinyl-diaminopimelate desuccinylase|uniref:succinyl-diaminopimelate desuccinylase n=1 Tax=Alteromonas macleodii TaxID=28108 RepID=UPI001282C1F0|nr:succinyl-diaminopimelate desuccinylase [Alteromonas macleodii]MEE3221321.1 succinyl-diaminopimelate desuccinylase [Pseudomonadota bacterium]CAI2390745.1 succinyldiaminopimelate desuccinylase [Alteromonas macleodii]CAI3963163.1 succinyldiaminopimelate desuccinylase [Alteromonas macleodii]CAI3963532.1 succinyldiaminopimelate desuccinylase [Alteromonas macleodii]CAI3963534.1 succinyldiaminopimelate desuccinylase [Alteromonas macleodii]|tara:strand:+ start:437 stop:1612 length:1176 start_codon:yes stop_codon:yes gene_type:complete